MTDTLRRYRSLRADQFPCAGRGIVMRAIIDLLQSAPRRNLFTSRTYPVWSGWATARMLGWHMAPECADAPFEFADPEERFRDVSHHLDEIMLDMADRRTLEKRICHPWRRNPSPDMASYQEWEFRLPGDAGCCYWEPGAAATLCAEDDWADMVNVRHRAILLDALNATGSQVPPYVLARIERRWQFQAKNRRVLLF